MHLGYPLSDILDHRVFHHSIGFGREQKLQVLKQMWKENREHVLGTIQPKRSKSDPFGWYLLHTLR